MSCVPSMEFLLNYVDCFSLRRIFRSVIGSNRRMKKLHNKFNNLYSLPHIISEIIRTVRLVGDVGCMWR
jgi:hypothetical protein